MHGVLQRHGLTLSRLCRSSWPPSLLPRPTRRCYGRRRDQATHTASQQTVSRDHSTEVGRSGRTAKDEGTTDRQDVNSDGITFRSRLREEAWRLQDTVVRDIPTPPFELDQNHGAAEDASSGLDDRYDWRVVFRRNYLRRIPKPKRYKPLLWEIQKIGRDYVKAGRAFKSLDRSVVATETLQGELRWIARNTPHPAPIRNILKILVSERQVKPTPSDYEALILGQCFPEHGSAENVKIILEEMEREGVPMEPSVLYAVLTALAVHPDTYLRSAVCSKLEQQWMSIPPLYTHLHILGMIREDQLELATVELDGLRARRIPTPAWLWVIYLHAVCERRDFEALLRLLYKLEDAGFPFPRPTLLHLLVTAGDENGDLEVCKWVWGGFVESMHVIPDEAICINVLRLAAKAQDVELAESVCVVLESVAGNTTTTPPSLGDQPPPTRGEMFGVTFDSPELPGTTVVTDNEQTTADEILVDEVPPPPGSDPTESAGSGRQPLAPPESLAIVLSTPPPLPPPSSTPIPPRKLPEEAVELLRQIRSDTDSDHPRKRGDKRKDPRRGHLYPMFREEGGLGPARFDPRLALMEEWDWRKK